MLTAVGDWENAYANQVNIAGGDLFPARWAERAASFRAGIEPAGRARLDIHHGRHPRDRHDLFLPDGEPRGLVVYLHGGYWMAFDKSAWSHLAAGALAHGQAVLVPSYPLCPEVTIATIVRHVAAAIEHAARSIDGPIALTGHSAGGHLAARLVTTTAPLDLAVQARIARVVPISGLHDLRPLMRLKMNGTLRIDGAEALAESPALLTPRPGTILTAWVGAGERAEFVRQNALIANVWRGLGAATEAVEEPDRHHFDVIDGLADPDHPLTRRLVGLGR